MKDPAREDDYAIASISKYDRRMLQNEPNNWLGLVLILGLIMVFALVIHWMGGVVK
jgi:hypothetical protein